MKKWYLGLFIIMTFLFNSWAFVQQGEMPAYMNPDLSIDERVDDLLTRMTLEEKIEQLGGDETGFSTKDNTRLGIPGLKCTDGPHGVRWEKSTAFPVSLLMGSTWNPDLIEKVGVALGKETKAKGRNQLLAPCMNVIRDPRGGRSAETFSEDPYLIGKMAVAYIRGVQSEKVIATPKHYAVNNQENGRMTNNVKVDERTLREFYLPHFEAAIKEGEAWSIMGAYNLMNNYYCCENKHLLGDILKDDWGFKGFVISDWGATHSTVESIKAGLDVEMPTAIFFGKLLLSSAVKGKKVPEETINNAVRRVLRAKFWAGLFDETPQPKNEPLKGSATIIDKSVVNCPEHKDLALQVAREGIVLLKNEGDILPLNNNKIKSIAVIGPNADVPRAGHGGSAFVDPFHAVTILEGIKNKVEKISECGMGNSECNKIEINFAKGCDNAAAVTFPVPEEFLVPPDNQPSNLKSPTNPPSSPFNKGGIQEGLLPVTNGLKGEYFNNLELQGNPVLVRVDKQIDFNWEGGSPDTVVGADNFSVRWTGKLIPRSNIKYLSIITDDGVRVYINDNLVVDNWTDHAPTTDTAKINLEQGQSYDIKIEYYERSGGAVARLLWSDPTDPFEEAKKVAKKSDVVVLALGLSSEVESEGIDRSNLDLPDIQLDLIDQISKVNKNIIAVLISGSVLTIKSWIDKVPAVMTAFYPGEQGGNAIAEILFGVVNPSGKLTVTFPESIEQLPPFDNNYEKAGVCRGYRYFEKNNLKPLFPFGYGLSYTKFDYSNLEISPAKMSFHTKDVDDGIYPVEFDVSLDIQNIGKYEGSEVIQLYIRDIESSVDRPLKELKGFKKVNLAPGEKKRITLTITSKELSFYDINKKNWVVEPGTFEFLIGDSSQDIKLKGSFEVEL